MGKRDRTTAQDRARQRLEEAHFTRIVATPTPDAEGSWRNAATVLPEQAAPLPTVHTAVVSKADAIVNQLAGFVYVYNVAEALVLVKAGDIYALCRGDVLDPWVPQIYHRHLTVVFDAVKAAPRNQRSPRTHLATRIHSVSA